MGFSKDNLESEQSEAAVSKEQASLGGDEKGASIEFANFPNLATLFFGSCSYDCVKNSSYSLQWPFKPCHYASPSVFVAQMDAVQVDESGEHQKKEDPMYGIKGPLHDNIPSYSPTPSSMLPVILQIYLTKNVEKIIAMVACLCKKKLG